MQNGEGHLQFDIHRSVHR